MRRIVLVRHAETALNAAGRYQSRIDMPLNARGRLQAHAAAAELRAGRWPAVWSSPARRATGTALALAAAIGTEPRVLPELRERDLGALDGQDKAAHRRVRPAQARQLESDPSYAPPGGESLDEALTRLCRGLATVVETTSSAHQPVLVVTHGGLMNALALRVGRPAAPGRGPVGNARALGLTVHPARHAGDRVTGSVDLWDVAPHVCEYPWPVTRPAALPWPATSFHLPREAIST